MRVIAAARFEPIQMRPSDWVHFALRIPVKGDMQRFSFIQREYLIPIYDRNDPKILLMIGRQSEKSTTQGNRMLALAAMLPHYKCLYVSPSQTQTRKFSQDRIAQPMAFSKTLRDIVEPMPVNNVHQKEFSNGSSIELRYAFKSADRVRGIPADYLAIDEFQDILIDNVPVLEETTSHSDLPNYSGWTAYSFTPKSLDNTGSYYWDKSTQTELRIPCERHGLPHVPWTWHWNIIGEANIGPTGLICEKCKQPIDRWHPMRGWIDQVKGALFRGYRLPQMLTPSVQDHQWNAKVWFKYKTYPRPKFFNEVMATPFESGMRPLSKGDLLACCNPEWTMSRSQLRESTKWHSSREIFAGVDYGCHDEQTRALTKDGFKYFRDLRMDDLVAQFDETNREMSFVHPTAITVREIDSSLYHFQGRGVDMMLTSEHRMLTRGAKGSWHVEEARVTASRRSDVELRGYVHWSGVERGTFTLPGLPSGSGYKGSLGLEIPMDTWLEFLGYAISEGGICTTWNRVRTARRISGFRITQRGGPGREWRIEKIRNCLARTGLRFKEFPGPTPDDHRWDISGKQVWSWVESQVGSTPASKRIPRAFLDLSPRQLRILFDALVFGDGTVDTRTGRSGGSYYSTSCGLCEDVQELAIRLGLRTISGLHKVEETDEKGYVHEARYRVGWSQGRDHTLNAPFLRKIKRVPYKGRVYCCTVPTGLIVTERNGRIAFQGNTAEHAWTVVALGTYFTPDKFRIFYLHRFTGTESDPNYQGPVLGNLFDLYKVKVSFGDMGMGGAQNHYLQSRFGVRKHHILAYVSEAKRRIYWNPLKVKWIGVRDELMNSLVNAIREKKLEFPAWPAFETFGQDILNITTEFNETRQRTQFRHHPDKPDDTFHAILYCLMAASLVTPRPDIFLSIPRGPATPSLHL